MMEKPSKQNQKSNRRTQRSSRSKPLPHQGFNVHLVGFEIRWRLKSILRWLAPLKTLLVPPGMLFVAIGVMMLGAAGLSGCATRLVATEVHIPQELRGRCERTPLPEKNPSDGLNELLAKTQKFSLSQEEDLNVCEAKSMAKDAIVDNHNRAARQATCPVWKVWGCR